MVLHSKLNTMFCGKQYLKIKVIMYAFAPSPFGDEKEPEAACLLQGPMKCKWEQIKPGDLFTQEDNSWIKMEDFNNQPVTLDKGQTDI